MAVPEIYPNIIKSYSTLPTDAPFYVLLGHMALSEDRGISHGWLRAIIWMEQYWRVNHDVYHKFLAAGMQIGSPDSLKAGRPVEKSVQDYWHKVIKLEQRCGGGHEGGGEIEDIFHAKKDLAAHHL